MKTRNENNSYSHIFRNLACFQKATAGTVVDQPDWDVPIRDVVQSFYVVFSANYEVAGVEDLLIRYTRVNALCTGDYSPHQLS